MASSHSWIFAFFMALCMVSSAAGWRRELTTRSWDILGFHENLPHSPQEDQIIIGVIDTGIWPESPSFSDQGLGPPPAKWKGICEPGHSAVPFKCNNKIIGARAYYPDDLLEGNDRSPRDTEGHGTHVAATLAGVPVKNVSLAGIGLGTARGAVPRARIAVYKVCWDHSCQYSTWGIRDAIHDGVDIISMSIGTWPWPYGTDGVSYATFAAMSNGIFASYVAGNNASLNTFTVNNVMPWVTTVGNSAGSGTDYITYVRTGDGKQFEGALMNIYEQGKTMYPLALNRDVTNSTEPEFLDSCIIEFMNPEVVKGKIILCPDLPSRQLRMNIDSLGVAGLIVKIDPITFQYRREGYRLPIRKTPVVVLKDSDFDYLVNYHLNSNKTGQIATANIAKSVVAPDTPARPSYSTGRGPSLIDMNVFKPDVSAPGVNIISAVPGTAGYDAKSGTSMAAPFLSGTAAYIKSFHPTWSPAVIKSAMMTTATPMSDPYKNASELAYGAGQVDPVRATDPGLVYDTVEMDYMKYLCQYGNGSNDLLFNVTRNQKYDCAKIPIEKNWQLNYPAFSIPVFTDQHFVKVFQRTVTNVGNSSASNYKAVVSAPETFNVKVEPSVLAFTEVGQSLSYTLTVEGVLPKRNVTTQVLSAYLVWTDGYHQVRSPIVVFERPVDMDEQAVKIIGAPFPK